MTYLRIARIWPLIFSFLALWGIARVLPDFYCDFLFWSDGVGATGWISGRACGQDPNGHPYFCYAYSVKGITYGGRGLYDDENSDIDFSDHPPIYLIYLPPAPWRSTIKPVAWNLRMSALWGSFCVTVFLGACLLSVLPRKKREF
jgi:hypothetical protein